MKNVWLVRKSGEILLFIVAIIFAILFYIAGQYWLSLFALLLIVIALRINDLKTFKASPKEGFTADFRVEDTKISKIITSPKPLKEKIEESQKVIDEVFKLGYLAGGGKPFMSVSNVKIMRDEDGKIIRYKYDDS